VFLISILLPAIPISKHALLQLSEMTELPQHLCCHCCYHYCTNTTEEEEKDSVQVRRKRAKKISSRKVISKTYLMYFRKFVPEIFFGKRIMEEIICILESLL